MTLALCEKTDLSHLFELLFGKGSWWPITYVQAHISGYCFVMWMLHLYYLHRDHCDWNDADKTAECNRASSFLIIYNTVQCSAVFCYLISKLILKLDFLDCDFISIPEAAHLHQCSLLHFLTQGCFWSERPPNVCNSPWLIVTNAFKCCYLNMLPPSMVRSHIHLFKDKICFWQVVSPSVCLKLNAHTVCRG